MDVRTAQVEPTVEHDGSVKSYFMYPKESLREETMGSYLEFVNEFQVEPGRRVEPHKHDTHEFYYVMSGLATMQIEYEKRDVGPGDLIHIPRNQVHSIWPTGDEPLRAFCFAVSFMPPGGSGTEAIPGELPDI